MSVLALLAGVVLAALASSAGAVVVTDPATGHHFGIVAQLGASGTPNAASSQRRGLSLTAPLSASCNADDGDCTQLSYNGGPVQHGEQDYLFFWAPTGYAPAFPASYVTGLQTWLTDVAGTDGSNGNPMSVNQQYYDLSGPGSSKSFVPYAVQNAGTISDTTAYPSTGNCPPASGYTVCLTDAQIQHELSSYIAANHLPTGLNTEYFVLTPQGVNSCFDTTSDSCASNSFCGYHSNFASSGHQILYADMPWLYGVSGCDISNRGTPHFGHANTDFIDPVVSVFSHELSETMTDPEPATGWVQNGGPDDGYEIGDKCAYIYGAGGVLSTSGLTQLSNLAFYNMQLGADSYLLQLEFDNQLSTCQGSLQEPASVSVPTVSGTPIQGQTITEAHGGWSPSATSYSYQWQDCDTSGANCSAIAGATGQAYTLTGVDAAHTIRAQEVGANDFGAATPVTSVATAVVLPLAPAVSGAPGISGAVKQSQSLTESHASWLNGPTAYSYQWQDCNSAGNDCSPIPAATGQAHTLSSADVGHTIRVQEAASNAGGSGTAATSAATTVVIPLAPSNTSAPRIAGTGTEGQTLTETHGSWSNSPTSYAYQWQDCGSSGGCSPITGATAQRYKLRSADLGYRVRVRETAVNAGGAGAPTSSASTTLVGPSVAHVAAALSSVVAPRGVNASISHLLTRNGYSASFSAPSRGSLLVSWHAGRALVATIRSVAGSGGVYKPRLVLTAGGRALLGRSGRLRIASTATFTPAGGGPITVRRTFALRR